jgi:hypothetical protein
VGRRGEMQRGECMTQKRKGSQLWIISLFYIYLPTRGAIKKRKKRKHKRKIKNKKRGASLHLISCPGVADTLVGPPIRKTKKKKREERIKKCKKATPHFLSRRDEPHGPPVGGLVGETQDRGRRGLARAVTLRAYICTCMYTQRCVMCRRI